MHRPCILDLEICKRGGGAVAKSLRGRFGVRIPAVTDLSRQISSDM